jgi:hypothetical protein
MAGRVESFGGMPLQIFIAGLPTNAELLAQFSHVFAEVAFPLWSLGNYFQKPEDML